MSILAKFLAITILMIGSSYAQEWIPYTPNYQANTTPVNMNIINHQQNNYNFLPNPTIVYAPVQYQTYQTVVYEQKCLFHTKKYITIYPTTVWYYSPIVFHP